MDVVQVHPEVQPDAPRFFFDLGSPSCWLVAERVLQVMPVATEWVPVLAAGLGGPREGEAFRCAEEESIWRSELERRARQLGVQQVRWPRVVPFDSAFAMRAATYAKGIGRTVAFAQAAFRQAWCAGRDLSDSDSVLIAAAACEMHPSALLKGAALKSTTAALERATEQARALGADRVPAIAAAGGLWVGEDAPERAAGALALA
jgi:2-hydroxychromene-2-carboxylate isomerase